MNNIKRIMLSFVIPCLILDVALLAGTYWKNCPPLLFKIVFVAFLMTGIGVAVTGLLGIIHSIKSTKFL